MVMMLDIRLHDRQEAADERDAIPRYPLLNPTPIDLPNGRSVTHGFSNSGKQTIPTSDVDRAPAHRMTESSSLDLHQYLPFLGIRDDHIFLKSIASVSLFDESSRGGRSRG